MDRLTWRALHHTLLVSFVMFTVATVVTAQTFTGAVRGAVREEFRAVVPGVTVQLVNEASNASREAVSNQVGEYSFGAVPPGTYSIRASLTASRGSSTAGSASRPSSSLPYERVHREPSPAG